MMDLRPNEYDYSRHSYETLLRVLREAAMSELGRERLQAELRSRDRAMHNQWVEICGGQFR